MKGACGWSRDQAFGAALSFLSHRFWLPSIMCANSRVLKKKLILNKCRLLINTSTGFSRRFELLHKQRQQKRLIKTGRVCNKQHAATRICRYVTSQHQERHAYKFKCNQEHLGKWDGYCFTEMTAAPEAVVPTESENSVCNGNKQLSSFQTTSRRTVKLKLWC